MIKVDLEGKEVKDLARPSNQKQQTGSGQEKVCVCRGEWGWYDKEG